MKIAITRRNVLQKINFCGGAKPHYKGDCLPPQHSVGRGKAYKYNFVILDRRKTAYPSFLQTILLTMPV